jgi:hypothetical protein
VDTLSFIDCQTAIIMILPGTLPLACLPYFRDILVSLLSSEGDCPEDNGNLLFSLEHCFLKTAN